MRLSNTALTARWNILTRDLQTHRRLLGVRRDELSRRIVTIEDTLYALGVRPSAGSDRPRRRPTGTIKYFIEKVLGASVEPMRVKDIAVAATRAGCKSKNKNLAHAVGIALSEMQSAVERVSLGMFRLR